MKKIIVTTKREEAPNILQVLGKVFFYQEDLENLTRFTIIVPDNELDGIISNLQQSLKFMDKKTLVEVYSPDFVIYPVEDEKKNHDTGEKKKSERSPIEKLLESAGTYEQLDLNLLILAAIAAIVALIGLFLNNIGIIIGSMLLSPLLGPIYAFALNTAVGRGRVVLLSFRTLLVLVGGIIVFSLVATWILSLFIPLPLTPEILSRMVSNPIYVVMAVILGFATIVALSQGIPEGIAGVAVAAALLPPAVVTGIAPVIYSQGTLGALILTLQNVFGLMAGSVAGVIALQIGPRSYGEKRNARTIIIRIAWLLAVMVLLLFFLSLLPTSL
ncbi:putative hydrophobic protein (TIGR00341 family) [Methanolinea mesophila]|uniref:TIGR00341 family protein n=1 Tax=Methanolinea mesophila TaxID=547055 RepID=UPI001AE1B1B9|nr:TIGR00341 family protein [Methanolinea mesophila]MBP1929237.1 putative hydrophobic protein (TIGR00341 family) [Methanolinea mesophila]